jgi:predicted phage tail protein
MSEQPSGDWITQFVDSLERVVTTIRKKTTEPAVTAVRGLVFGLVGGVLGAVVLVLVTIIAVRVLTYAGRAMFATGAWFAYLITGAIFVMAGLVLMRRRHAPPERP